MERNENELEELDVEAVLAFAEHIVLNARRLWSEFPLQHRRRMQKVLFPEGLVFDGEAFRTPVTCLFFRDLEASEPEEARVVHLLRKGVPLPDIQRQLGHLNLATTDVYLRGLGAGEHVEKVRDLEW